MWRRKSSIQSGGEYKYRGARRESEPSSLKLQKPYFKIVKGRSEKKITKRGRRKKRETSGGRRPGNKKENTEKGEKMVRRPGSAGAMEVHMLYTA